MAELKQFCILASKQKGRACAALIQQVISNKKIFNYGDLLSMNSVNQLNEDNGEYNTYYNTLELFAYGKYIDYVNNKEKYLELNDLQIIKLKQLTIVSLAEKSRNINYSILQNELDINDIRLLEDLIIDTIYLGLIKGKLNQRQQTLRIIDTMRRDVRPNQLRELIDSLKIWQENVATLIDTVEKSSGTVRNYREQGKLELESTQKNVDATKVYLKDRSDGPSSGMVSILDIAQSGLKSQRARGGRGIGRNRDRE